MRGRLRAAAHAELREHVAHVMFAVPTRVADDPLPTVAIGTGRALDEMELLERRS